MNILFVCTGNTCRSCMAEAIFNKQCDIKTVKAFSAGLNIIPSSTTSKHSATLVMENLRVDISERKAVQITENMLKEMDLVLTMTKYMANVITSEFNDLKNKVYSLNEYVSINGDISDPYGGDLDRYKDTYKNMEISIKLLLKKLREDKGM
ncbi:protein-tyrosine phosphatase [Clostridium acidisoli DSM 12555]|uniref:Protein-tyrosine phosphatase n=1 Tax=Clostridium acidisoli DSM 12555 TaxID=1121291 RepID=A0A1W1XWA4_9CLOT|nr:low molecular weight protein arginine phosphatase [Clostridium acidisoli]SMC28157.1 protein-tyrosine phosphatase [Clostridium acidisoli DSM 12555]